MEHVCQIKCQTVDDFLDGVEYESLDVIVTDPPYSGMNAHLKLGKGRIVGDGSPEDWFMEIGDDPDAYSNLLFRMQRRLKPGGHIFMMFDTFSLLTLGHAVREVFAVKNVLVWDKVNIGMGHNFRRRHEFIVFAAKPFSSKSLLGKCRTIESNSIPDILAVKRLHGAAYPTQKPVELFEMLIAASRGSIPREEFVVCDPFLGSGTTAVAAQRQGVQFIGSEPSLKGFQMSCERVAAVGSGKTDFAQPKAAAEVAEWWARS